MFAPWGALATVADLLRPSARVAQRGPGAGATKVLERALGGAPTSGPRVASHVEAAHAVLLGACDAAVVVEPVAEAFGLPFVPLSEERFELVVPRAHRDLPGVARLLDRLASAGFLREVSGMGAYDVAAAGARREVA